MGRRQRVVVTGLGVTTPIGIGIESFWDALIARECGIHRIEVFDPSGLQSQVGGELPTFKLGDYVRKTYRKNAKVMSRDILIAVVCAYHAVKDAALNTKCIVERGEAPPPPNVDSTRFGSNIGAGLICADLNELASALATAAGEDGVFDLRLWGSEGMGNLTPLWLLKFLPNMLACHVTIVHDAQAPSNTITCAEASSHLAIGEAFRTIARGDADVCICGGAESKINPMAVARSQLLGRLNLRSNDDPQRACLPFGAARNGSVVSEGGGLVILESLEHARRRGARIYAEMAGLGASTNTHHWSKPDPDGTPIARALRAGLEDAQIEIGDIDLAVPFGAGTIEHDASEMAGWNTALAARLNEIPALTTRGALGINGAGTGAIDFAATVMALARNTVPPSINTDRLDEECRFRFVQGDPIDANIRHAITLGHAVTGGQTAALIIKDYEE